jgi:hypothetical protein
MYFNRIQRRLDELAQLGCIEIDNVVPCTEEDLVALEGKLRFRLPDVVRELYLWGGRDFGCVFGGMDVLDFEAHMENDYGADVRETLEEAGEDAAILGTQPLVMQMDCDGQFSFVRADDGDDPAVYTHTHQEPTFSSCARFSDYLSLMVEQLAGVEEIELVRSARQLARLAELRALRIQHLLFSGEMEFAVVPNEVFSFRELRSLNLFGKGLLELPSRIGELTLLRRLDLARNSLSSLPMALSQLDELQDLDLADNQLSTVIDVLRKLPALRYARLSGNPIAPEEIDQLQSELSHVEFTIAESH